MRKTEGLLAAADAVLVAGAVVAAYLVRFDGDVPAQFAQGMPWMAVGAATVRVALLVVFGLYERVWAYASLPELSAVVMATVAGSVLFLVVNGLAQPPMVPRSILAIELLLSTAAIGGVRLGLRLRAGARRPRVGEQRLRAGGPQGETGGPHRRPAATKRILVVGAGDAGAMAVREIRRSTPWQVVGLIDDDPAKQGRSVYGVPVLGGRDRIAESVRRLGVTEVLIAIPSASRQVVRALVEVSRATGAEVRILPALYELMDGRVTVNQIREVRIEDLLGRDPVQVDSEAIASYVRGRRVLVTGAGGSIGSELCRQVARFSPEALVMMGHGENSLFQIDLELSRTYPGLSRHLVVGDIRHRARVRQVWWRFRPEVVFHAAAHKHVPLMELNPEEAVTNNVLGTLYLIETSMATGVERFVLISTDKAVRPTSAMGASKRVAERLVQAAAAAAARDGGPRFVAVRFGNVIGSRGSVVQVFRRQILEGGPVTVTDPEMRRYFMTIPEAVQLVIQAGALGAGGEVFVLDMGEPVRILDLARDMIRLSGFEPDVDIPVRIVGARPGEKLFESLADADEVVERTGHPKILRVQPPAVEPEWLAQGVERLKALVERGAPAGEMKAALLAVAHGRPVEVPLPGEVPAVAAIRRHVGQVVVAEGVATQAHG